MGKDTDGFKGDQKRKASDERPFLKRGISISDINNFNRKDYQRRIENHSKLLPKGKRK